MSRVAHIDPGEGPGSPFASPPPAVEGECYICHRPSFELVCLACQPEVEAARQRREAKELAEHRAGLIAEARASVPSKWRRRRLEGGEPPLREFLFAKLRRTDRRLADKLADAAIRRALEAPLDVSITILGPGGMGKTSLAAAIAMTRVDAGERDPGGPLGQVARGFLFVSVAEAGAAKRAVKFGAPDPPIIVNAQEAPLIVLDDVGASEGGQEDAAAAAILGARYRSKGAPLPWIATTWLTPDEVYARLDDGIARRFLEDSLVIDLNLPSERRA